MRLRNSDHPRLLQPQYVNIGIIEYCTRFLHSFWLSLPHLYTSFITYKVTEPLCVSSSVGRCV